MKVYQGEIEVKTKGENDMVDLTDEIQRIVRESGVREGIACVFVPGSTGAVTTIEYEPGLMKDMPAALERIAPRDEYYHHHETWHDYNGHSHVRASIIGPSLTIPITNGEIVHGTWQQIVFMEMDVRSRHRRILVKVLGE